MSVCEKVEALERQLLEDIHELSMKNEELILQLVESRVMSVLIQDIKIKISISLINSGKPMISFQQMGQSVSHEKHR